MLKDLLWVLVKLSVAFCEAGVIAPKLPRMACPSECLLWGPMTCWDKGVSHLCDHLGHGDFLIPGPSGAHASLAYALGQFRKLLVAIGGLSTAQARNYTLHSLKTTGLTWALQLDVDHVQRRLWGHHRGGDSGSKMTTKYSRDDVLPALRAQLKGTRLRSWRVGSPSRRKRAVHCRLCRNRLFLGPSID